MPTTPARTTPATPVTELLIGLAGITGAAAIALLTFGHQLWPGLICAAAAGGLLWVTDRRLRRRAEIRRDAAATAEREPGQPGSPRSDGSDR